MAWVQSFSTCSSRVNSGWTSYEGRNIIWCRNTFKYNCQFNRLARNECLTSEAQNCFLLGQKDSLSPWNHDNISWNKDDIHCNRNNDYHYPIIHSFTQSSLNWNNPFLWVSFKEAYIKNRDNVKLEGAQNKKKMEKLKIRFSIRLEMYIKME